MKKLSVLVALMLIITVGGVYATWNYARATNPITPGTASIGVKLETITYDDVAEGVITAAKSPDFAITIDQADSEFTAGLVTNGVINVTYTPYDNTVRQEIPMQFEVNGTLPGGIEINSNPIPLNNGRATSSVTITAANIAAAIDLNELKLPTVEAYTAFKNALGNGNITITISEYDAGEGYIPDPQ